MRHVTVQSFDYAKPMPGKRKLVGLEPKMIMPGKYRPNMHRDRLLASLAHNRLRCVWARVPHYLKY